MVVGARDQLRLTAILHLTVLGEDAAHHLELGLDDRFLVLLREVTSFSDQLRKDCFSLDRFRPDPGQVEPHLQIGQLAVGEELRQLRVTARPGLLLFLHQLEVSRILPDPADLARFGHPARDECALITAEVADRTPGKIEIDIGEPAADVAVDLVQQRRDQVEGLVDQGKSVEHGRHLVVVLGASQAHPGKQEGAGQVVAIVGLVHVPDKSHMQGLGHGGK